MDVRFDLKSNIEERANRDRDAVKQLREELSAAGAKVDELADSGGNDKGKPKAFSASSWADKDALKFAQQTHAARVKWADDRARAEEKAEEKAAQAREKAADKAKSKAREGAEFLFGAAAGAAGVSGAASLGKLALGYQGVARLQALGFRTSVQMRQLFQGVDSGPATRAADNLLNKIFSKSSATGKAISGLLNRGFNGFFSFLEQKEPVITAFFQGAVIAGLKLEETYYNLATAALPFTTAIESTLGPLGEMKVAAVGGQVAVGGLVLAASGAAAPFVAAAGAIAFLVEQIQKLKREAGDWGSFKKLIGNKLRGDLGFETQEEFDQKRRAPSEGETGFGMSAAELKEFNAKRAVAIAAADAANGKDSGREYANGVAIGLMDGSQGVDQAAELLAKYTDAGFRRGAKIRSPSKVAEETAGYWPQGAVKGIEGGASAVQAAADRMVPKMPGGAAGGGASGGGGAAGGIFRFEISVNVTGGASVAEEEAMTRIAEKVFGAQIRSAIMACGIPVR